MRVPLPCLRRQYCTLANSLQMPKRRVPKKHRRSKPARPKRDKIPRNKKSTHSRTPRKRAAKKRSAKKRVAKKRSSKRSSKRSTAAKKGWAKRRKRERLYDAMREWRDTALPTSGELYDYLEWFSRRLNVDISQMYRWYRGS